MLPVLVPVIASGVDGDVAGVGQLEAVGDGLAGGRERCRIGCWHNGQRGLRGKGDGAAVHGRGKSTSGRHAGGGGVVGNGITEIACHRRVGAGAGCAGAGRERGGEAGDGSGLVACLPQRS